MPCKPRIPQAEMSLVELGVAEIGVRQGGLWHPHLFQISGCHVRRQKHSYGLKRYDEPCLLWLTTHSDISRPREDMVCLKAQLLRLVAYAPFKVWLALFVPLQEEESVHPRFPQSAGACPHWSGYRPAVKHMRLGGSPSSQYSAQVR